MKVNTKQMALLKVLLENDCLIMLWFQAEGMSTVKSSRLDQHTTDFIHVFVIHKSPLVNLVCVFLVILYNRMLT